MTTSAKTVCGAGAAFAVGVIATLAVVNLSGREPPVASQGVQTAAQRSSPHTERRAWSDPAQRPNPAALAPHESRPSLTFTLGNSGHHDGPGQPQRASAGKQEEATPAVAQPRGSAVRVPGPTKAAKLTEDKRASARASRNELQVSQVLSKEPLGKPGIVRQAARERLAIIGEATSAYPRSRAAPQQPETGPRRLVAADLGTRHQEARLPLDPTTDQHSIAAAREARRIVPVRVTRHADAQLDEDATPAARSRHGSRTAAPEPKRHYSSAETGGVMGWLME